MKLNKQGVRDLDTRQPNGKKPCRHFWGPFVVLSTELAYDPDWGTYFNEPVYGKRCIHCGTESR